jgi:hypothetical protein
MSGAAVFLSPAPAPIAPRHVSRKARMHSIIYMVGLVVIVLAVLSLVGLS